MKSANSPSHVRRAQIVSLSLTELMLLLVFMAIAFSFLAKEEGQKDIPRIQAQLDEAKRENERLTRENSKLSLEVARLRRFLDQLNIDGASMVPRNGTIRFPDGTVYVKQTGRAPGNPQCVIKGRYLLELSLLPGRKIQGVRLWSDEDTARIASLAGIEVLSSGKPLGLAEFEAAANPLKVQSLARDDCVYAVRTKRETNDADEYDTEQKLIYRYFNISYQ